MSQKLVLFIVNCQAYTYGHKSIIGSYSIMDL